MQTRTQSISQEPGLWQIRFYSLFFIVLLLASCASAPYRGASVESQDFLNRVVMQQQGDLQVSVAVPDAGETLQLTGLDLYEQGIQPVWLKIENSGKDRVRIATWSIDREYFSPIEVAYMNRKKFSKQGYSDMERWFYTNGLPRFVPPGETRSGLVFTHLRPGTKGFNLVIFTRNSARDFTFFVPLPGFVPDFEEVDFENLYDPEKILDLDKTGLMSVLEDDLGCCAVDSSGELLGAPLNVVLVGSGMAIRRAMLRGDWFETSMQENVGFRAREQYFKGRRPDGIYSKLRPDGNERLQMGLWLSPWQFDSEPVWIGFVHYFTEENSLLAGLDDETVRNSELLSFFSRESVSADLDSAQRFLFQNVWYNGSLRALGWLEGVGNAPVDKPRTGFEGNAYFTDGLRLLLHLSEEPMAIDDASILHFHPNKPLQLRSE